MQPVAEAMQVAREQNTIFESYVFVSKHLWLNWAEYNYAF